MECRFTYTSRELRTGVAAHSRLGRIGTVLSCLFGWIFFAGLGVYASYADSTTLLDNLPVFLVPLFLTIFFFSPLLGWTSVFMFRKNPLFNQVIAYQLDERGFTLRSDVLSQTAAWAAVGKAGETAKGFVLYWGKSKRNFHWLPKHGFSSPEDIAACRLLLQENVRDFKQV